MAKAARKTSADDEFLPQIRKCLSRRKNLKEKKMFGGTGFLLSGNMCCGAHKGRLILRLGPDTAAIALREPHVRPFDITGKPMRGWVMLDFADISGDTELRRWISLAAAFASGLPPKE